MSQIKNGGDYYEKDIATDPGTLKLIFWKVTASAYESFSS